MPWGRDFTTSLFTRRPPLMRIPLTERDRVSKVLGPELYAKGPGKYCTMS